MKLLTKTVIALLICCFALPQMASAQHMRHHRMHHRMHHKMHHPHHRMHHK